MEIPTMVGGTQSTVFAAGTHVSKDILDIFK
jgi:hypothetical protein